MCKTENKRLVLAALIGAIGGQKILADRIGVCQKTVSKWLNGVVNIPLQQALKLSRIADELQIEGVSVRSLMTHIKWGDN